MLGLLSRKLNILSGTVMSTEILIKADIGKKYLETALRLAEDIERKLSAYREDSFVSKINKYAGLSAVKCSEDVIEIISESLRIAEKTEGLFDPTIGSLTHGLFGFGTGRERIPSPSEIERVKELVDYRKVRITGNEVFLEKEGMRLDLGGIAKGWTAQKLAELLIDKGANEVLVSIGGEICTFGRKWKIAIKDAKGEGYMGIVETKEGKTTISTSGDYERFIKLSIYHHILNPRKGKQENFYSSLTIIEDGFRGAEVDALTTACFNLPAYELRKFTESYILLTKDTREFRVGPGLKKKVKGVYLMLNEDNE